MISLHTWARSLTGGFVAEEGMVDLLKEIGDQVKETALSKFGELQGPIGPFPAWKPLAQYTITKKGFDDPLIDSGLMAAPDSTGVTVDAGELSVTIGNVIEYALYQELGFMNAVTGENVPPRPVYGPAGYEVVTKNLKRFGEAAVAGLFYVFGGRTRAI